MALEQMMSAWFNAATDALTQMRLISTDVFVKIRTGNFTPNDWASSVAGMANAGMTAWAKLLPYGSTIPIAVINTTVGDLKNNAVTESVFLCEPLEKAGGNWPLLTIADLQCVTGANVPALKADVSVSSQVGESILVAVKQAGNATAGIFHGVVMKYQKVLALVVVFVA